MLSDVTTNLDFWTKISMSVFEEEGKTFQGLQEVGAFRLLEVSRWFRNPDVDNNAELHLRTGESGKRSNRMAELGAHSIRYG